MIMKESKQIGFIYKNNESIDKILKDGDVVFEKGFLREKTSTTLPINFGGVGKDLKDYRVYGNTVQNGEPTPDAPIEMVSCGDNETGLPFGYTQVDFIENSGTQYIDTGFKPNQDTSIEMEVLIPEDSNDITRFFESRNQTSVRESFGIINFKDSNNQIQLRYNTQKGATPGLNTNTKYKITTDKKQLYVDDVLVLTANNATFQVNYNLYLFGFANASSLVNPSVNGTYKLYNFKIYDNDTLIRNFIPCYRNSDNEVGLYDLVTNVFYTNQGTGTFIYGSEIEKGGYKIPINVRSENLFDKNNDIQLGKTATFTGEEDNEFTVSSNSSRTVVIVKVPSNEYISIAINNDVYKETRFFVSHLKTKSVEAGKSENQWFSNSATILTPNNANYIGLVLIIKKNGTTQTATQELINDIGMVITTGSTVPDKYIPYYNQTTNIYLDEPLRKIGDYTDYIDFVNGKVVRNIGEIILNGTENWVLADIYNNISQFDYSNVLIKKFTTADNIALFANYFGTTNRWSQSWLKDNIALHRANYNKIRIQSSNFTTLEDFKTWLSTHNTIVDYILATPTEEDIELPNIPTIDGNNTLNIETEITPSQVYIKYKSNE